MKNTEPFPVSPLTVKQHLKISGFQIPVCPQTIPADLSRDDIFICHRPKVLNTFPPGAEGERTKLLKKWNSFSGSGCGLGPPSVIILSGRKLKTKKTI